MDKVQNFIDFWQARTRMTTTSCPCFLVGENTTISESIFDELIPHYLSTHSIYFIYEGTNCTTCRCIYSPNTPRPDTNNQYSVGKEKIQRKSDKNCWLNQGHSEGTMDSIFCWQKYCCWFLLPVESLYVAKVL